MTFTVVAKRSDLKHFFSAIGIVAEEAYVSATPEDMTFRGMDPAHIGLVDIAYPAKAFERYSGKKLQFGITVKDVLGAIERFGKDEIVTLTEADSRLVLKSESKEFRLHMVDGKASSTALPVLKFDVKIKAPRSVIQEALADIALVSEYVKIDATPEGLTFSGKGDMDQASRGMGCEYDGEGKAIYSLEWLIKIVKAVETDDLKIEFSTKKPLKISFGAGWIRYFLAPKVE